MYCTGSFFVHTAIYWLVVLQKDGFKEAVCYPSIFRPLIANVYTLAVFNLRNM